MSIIIYFFKTRNLKLVIFEKSHIASYIPLYIIYFVWILTKNKCSPKEVLNVISHFTAIYLFIYVFLEIFLHFTDGLSRFQFYFLYKRIIYFSITIFNFMLKLLTISIVSGVYANFLQHNRCQVCFLSCSNVPFGI